MLLLRPRHCSLGLDIAPSPSTLLLRDLVLRLPDRSREAAQDYSPGRKPGVENEKRPSPERAKAPYGKSFLTAKNAKNTAKDAKAPKAPEDAPTRH